MKVLVIGANGATGKHVVGQLLKNDSDVRVKAMVRSASRLQENWRDDPRVEIVEASIIDLSVNELQEHLSDCNAVVSTLGHNLSFKGIYGKPRKLVRDAIIKVCQAVEQLPGNEKVKVILMNTNGNRNRKTNEKIDFKDRLVIGLLRGLLPPHVDNEQAADFLWKNEKSFRKIEWTAVRPDNLTIEKQIAEYQVFESPIQSAIFKKGETSRINVGEFMSRLILEDNLWNQWNGKMPVIYNKSAIKD